MPEASPEVYLIKMSCLRHASRRVFIVLFSLYILIVVVAFSSCLVIALQKSMKVLVSINFKTTSLPYLYSVLGKSLFCR